MNEIATTRLLALCAVLMACGFGAIQLLGDLMASAVELIAIVLLLSLFYLVCCYLVINRPASRGRRRIWLIWAAAIVFRLTVVSLPPTLSEDLARYRWQGKLQQAGGDPYVDFPADPRWRDLRDSTWSEVTGKRYASVYGPVYEMLYAGWYRTAAWLSGDEAVQVWSFRLPFALFELGAALALAWLIRLMGLAPERILIYLWCPLQVVEFWAQGHNDSLAVLLVVLALCFARRKQSTAACAWLTAATLTKFWPLILFPFLLLERTGEGWRLRWKAALVIPAVALVLALPYLGTLSHASQVLEGFVGGWRNNDSLFGLIFGNRQRNFGEASDIVKTLFLAGLAGLWTLGLPLERSAKWAVAGLLALSANCFPWYLSWLVPFLALAPDAGLLLWTGTAVLAYHTLIRYGILRTWDDFALYKTLEYWPVYGMLASSGLLKLYRGLMQTRISNSPSP